MRQIVIAQQHVPLGIKDKLCNRCVADSEVQFNGCFRASTKQMTYRGGDGAATAHNQNIACISSSDMVKRIYDALDKVRIRGHARGSTCT